MMMCKVVVLRKVRGQHDVNHDGEGHDSEVHDGLDTDEAKACVVNEGGMVGSISFDDNEDAIFKYDSAL